MVLNFCNQKQSRLQKYKIQNEFFDKMTNNKAGGKKKKGQKKKKKRQQQADLRRLYKKEAPIESSEEGGKKKCSVGHFVMPSWSAAQPWPLADYYHCTRDKANVRGPGDR